MAVCYTCGGKRTTTNMMVEADSEGRLTGTKMIEVSCGTCGGSGQVITAGETQEAYRNFEEKYFN